MSEISLNFCIAKVFQCWETNAEIARFNKQDLSEDCYYIQTVCYAKSLSPQPGNSLGFQLKSFTKVIVIILCLVGIARNVVGMSLTQHKAIQQKQSFLMLFLQI